jgi:hypothetical protein
MREVLLAVEALPGESHTNVREVTDLIAVEIFFKRLDLASEAGPLLN